MSGIIERRNYPRIKIRWPIRIHTTKGMVSGETRDISADGLSIACDDPLHLDKTYKILINPAEDHQVEVSGRIVWSDLYDLQDGTTIVAMGICFVDISDKDRRMLTEIASIFLE